MERKFRLPQDIPLREYPPAERFLEEARRLADEARQQGLILRVMGPIALHFYFPNYVELYRRMERLGERVFTDIDYAAYGKHRGRLVPFFEKQGYDYNKRLMMLFGQTRHIYYGERIPMIDVFFDSLDMNHRIDYKDRLELDTHCVSLSDLLLQKLQIVQINNKDLKDAMLLLLAAPLSDADCAAINTRYLARLFAHDWGFYYTATNNLARVRAATAGVAALSEEQQRTICDKADHLLHLIEQEPKSGQWKRRARVGTAKPWYHEVSDWG